MRSALCLVRCELYRLVHLRYFWVCLVLAVVLGGGFGTATIVVDGVAGDISGRCVAVGLIGAMMVGYFVGTNQSDGTLKNIMQVPRARSAYAVTVLAVCGAVTVTFMAALVGTRAIALGAAGRDPSAVLYDALQQSACYVFLRVLWTACVAVFAGGKAVGVAAGVFMGYGVADLLLISWEPLSPMAEFLHEHGMLITSLQGHGAALTPVSVLLVLVSAVVSVALMGWAMRRKDVTNHAD